MSDREDEEEEEEEEKKPREAKKPRGRPAGGGDGGWGRPRNFLLQLQELGVQLEPARTLYEEWNEGRCDKETFMVALTSVVTGLDPNPPEDHDDGEEGTKNEVDEAAYSKEYKCDRCGNRKTTLIVRQTRAQDEGDTLFITCVVCKYQWTKS